MTFDDTIDPDVPETTAGSSLPAPEVMTSLVTPNDQAVLAAGDIPAAVDQTAVAAPSTSHNGAPAEPSGAVTHWDLAQLTIEDIDLSAGIAVALASPALTPRDSTGDKPTAGSAALNDDWNRAQALLESQEILETRVTGYNQGGLTVAFGRLRGFVPNSHLSMVPRNATAEQQQQILSGLVNKTIPVRVLEVQRKRRRLLLSERLAERGWREQQRHDLISHLQVGDRIAGRVRSITNFGVFIDLGGADGLIHLSELSWHRVKRPQEVVAVGEEILVEVIRVEPERGRIALSRKRALANPWDQIEQHYWPGQLVTVQITNMVSFGAFAQIEPGVEGLIHISELSDDYIDHPRQVVQRGQEYTARVLEIDHEHGRISLSLKQAPQWLVAPTSEPASTDRRDIDSENEPSSIADIPTPSPAAEGQTL